MKRRNDDAQITKAEYDRRAARPPPPPGAFQMASPGTLASRKMAQPSPGWRARAAAPLARDVYGGRVRRLNEQFAAFARSQLAADPEAPLVEAARDYLHYAARLEARFLQKKTDVLSFGSGDCGQLAHSDTLEDERDTVVARPRVVLALRDKRIAQLSCGGLHNVACTADGKCYTWGCNDEGSLGRLGDEAELYMPGVIDLKGQDVVAVAAGGSQTFAVTKAGAVYGWGCYKDKEGKQWFDPASPGDRNIKRKQTTPLKISGLEKVVAVACGAAFNAAVTADGACLTWGLGEVGSLGRPVGPAKPDEYDFRALSEEHLAPSPLKLAGACKVAGCGAYHLLVATSTGLVACGLNNYGQVGDGTTTDAPAPVTVRGLEEVSIAQLGGGEHHSLALLGDGTIYTWGRADYGQLGLGEQGAKEAGSSQNEPKLVPSTPSMAAIACGDHHCLALARSGTVYAWGYGDMHALGLGKAQDQFTPKAVEFRGAGVERVCQVAGGGQHSMVVAAVEGR